MAEGVRAGGGAVEAEALGVGAEDVGATARDADGRVEPRLVERVGGNQAAGLDHGGREREQRIGLWGAVAMPCRAARIASGIAASWPRR